MLKWWTASFDHVCGCAQKDFPEIWWPYEYWTEPSEVDPDDQAFYRKNLQEPNSKAQLLVDTGTLEDDFGQTGNQSFSGSQ